MTKQFRLAISLLAFAAIAIGLGLYSRTPNAPSVSTKLRLAYRPLALADITPMVIKEAGLETPAVAIELVPVPSPQIALQRFDAGEVDAIAGLTMEAVLQRLAAGDPGFRAFYFQVDVAGQGWVSLVANRRLGTVGLRDLAGKSVASLPTDQARFLVSRVLQSSGIPDSDIHVVDYNPATPLLGLESGEHDALFGLEPAISRAVAQGHMVVARGPVSQQLFESAPVPLSASVIRTAFRQEHPEAYAAFVELYKRAVDLQSSQQTSVRAYFEKQDYGALPADVRTNIAFPNMALPEAPGVLSTLQRFVATLRAAGVLKAEVDVRQLVQ